MNISRRALSSSAFLVGIAVGCAGCTVTGDGGYGGVGVSYVGGYYEPYGYDYGGWGPDYVVGPGRYGSPHGNSGEDHGSGGYRRAAPGRPMPSIPQRPRHR